MSSERQARASFYGMMVLEGAIAMIWAGAALMVYNLFPALMGKAPGAVLSDITGHFLGKYAGTVNVLSVIILAVTSGDTAMRSLRLSMAEMFHIDQKPLWSRLLMVLPLIALTLGLLIWSNANSDSFQKLWTYFAWSNQVIAAFALLAGSIYLFSIKRPAFITVIPGAFIMFVVTTYILWISPAHGGPVGLGLELSDAYMISGFLTVITFTWAKFRGNEVTLNK
jgi:carbon starvation protein CstA